jgi:hypothetical protein
MSGIMDAQAIGCFAGARWPEQSLEVRVGELETS